MRISIHFILHAYIFWLLKKGQLCLYCVYIASDAVDPTVIRTPLESKEFLREYQSGMRVILYLHAANTSNSCMVGSTYFHARGCGLNLVLQHLIFGKE